MSTDFDWQTEEDEGFDPHREATAVDANPSPYRAYAGIFLLVVALLAGAGWLGYRQLRQRVEDSTAAARHDVLSSYELVSTAVARNDDELLTILLSGRSASWSETQKKLVEQDLLLDRAFAGLRRQEEPATLVEVVVLPDLLVAEVTYRQLYTAVPVTAVPAAAESARTIALQHTAVYRRGDDRWLLAPPGPEFWGNRIVSRGRHLTLAYPERDAPVSERLAADLEGALINACRRLRGLTCPADLQLHVILVDDPASLLEMATPETGLNGAASIRLPAPTLFGLPVDEAGYQALYRAYAGRVLALFLISQTDWTCCERALLFQALLDKQLHELGLRPWPISAADYQQTLRQPIVLSELSFLWSDTAVMEPALWEKGPAYALADFLDSQPGAVPLLEMQRNMSAARGFNTWLLAAARPGAGELLASLESDWRDFLRRQIMSAPQTPPLPWPEQDLLLMCNDGRSRAASLYRYDLKAASWRLELSERNIVIMTPLPDYESLLLTEDTVGSGRSDQLQTTLWRQGEEIPVAGGLILNRLLLGNHTDPAGRYLPLQAYDITTGQLTAVMLDLENCRNGDCPLPLRPGFPTWSPDGTQTLLQSPTMLGSTVQRGHLWLGDHQGSNLVELTNTPSSGQVLPPNRVVLPAWGYFWLDNETYGYVSATDPNDLLMATVANPDPEPLLTRADLAAILPEDSLPDRLRLHYVVAMPAPSNGLLLHYGDSVVMSNFFLTLAWPSRQLSLVGELINWQETGFLFPPTFSPDGRWLITVHHTGRPDQFQLQFYDLEQSQTDMFLAQQPFVSWSSDGQWFAQLSSLGLLLTAPGTTYQHLVAHDFTDCTAVSWINRRGP
jgi:hypothetical protein